MNPSILNEVLAHWGSTYGLRHVPALNRYRGVVDGVALDAWVEDTALCALFFAPGASLVSQVAEDFSGFEHVAALGVPGSCLSGAVSPTGLNERVCVLRLTLGQIQTLDPDHFLQIPMAIARDCQAFGADPDGLQCTLCGCPAPDELAEVRGEYLILCAACLEGTRSQIASGTTQEHQNVNWPRAMAVLLVSTVLFAWIWGSVQDPKWKLDLMFLIGIPFGGVIAHSWLVVRGAGGINSTLVWCIFASSMTAVLLGNIRGFQIHCAVNQIPLTWNQAAWLYLTVHLREAWSTEFLYFIGAVLGLYLISRMRPSPTDLAQRL